MPGQRHPCRQFGFKRVLNAMGVPTILGANTASDEVRAAVDSILQVNVEIDELQAAASRLISQCTGAEAGCVTSSCSAALAVAAAAAITGSDLAAITRLPDTDGLRNRIAIPYGHDVNFGASVAQMVRISGAEVVRFGTASHCDGFHLRGALDGPVAAIVYVDSGDVNPAGSFLPLEECVSIAGSRGIPVFVDAAAAADLRPFLAAGASLVMTSAHKLMGAPTSGVICGERDLVRACYLQHYGIGRAMKVGKEGIVGCMAAMAAWYGEDARHDQDRWSRLSRILGEALPVAQGRDPSVVRVRLPDRLTCSATSVANALREGDPPVWVQRADDRNRELWVNLRVMTVEDAVAIARRIAEYLRDPESPVEDVAYHDLYWSERRLLEWPDWR